MVSAGFGWFAVLAATYIKSENPFRMHERRRSNLRPLPEILSAIRGVTLKLEQYIAQYRARIALDQ